jgi:hypothetical protein
MDIVENNIKSIISPDIVQNPQSPILTQDIISEGNLGNITLTTSIDISVKPGVMEYIQLGQNFSPKEITTYTTLFK